jgi:hypothetical protein
MRFPRRLLGLTVGFFLLIGALVLTSVAAAATRPLVLELFTSEGCSSCPPAEAYVGELAGRSDILALAFHVDYWDDQGWRDRFELSQATTRQRVYGGTLRLRNVYTPQFIVDGRADLAGTGRSGVDKVLQEPREDVPVTLSAENGEIRIRLESSDLARRSEIILVSYLRKAVSGIGRGENVGRTLAEYNIVRSLRSLGRWDGSAHDFSASLAALPRDATDVAVLVQTTGQGAILGAATLPLH